VLLTLAGCAAPVAPVRPTSDPTFAPATATELAPTSRPSAIPGTPSPPSSTVRPSLTATPSAREATLTSVVAHPSPASATAFPATPGTPAPSPTERSDVTLRHVFLIVMENKESDAVFGSPDAPYLTRLAARYAQADRYYAIGHPSAPNYLALLGGDTFGVSDDCYPCDPRGPSLADQIEAHGRSWKGYFEGLPRPCYLGPDTGGYAAYHNPFFHWQAIRSNPERCGHVVPLPQLARDLVTNSAPDFAWIGPNLCHQTHDCPVRDGDAWLASLVPTILDSPAWRDGGVLIVTYDEGTTDTGCCQEARGGRVPFVLAASGGPLGYRSATPYSHYSLLRTIEASWRLGYLGHAGDLGTRPMADLFPSLAR
jgi:hypothetical protein